MTISSFLAAPTKAIVGAVRQSASERGKGKGWGRALTNRTACTVSKAVNAMTAEDPQDTW